MAGKNTPPTPIKFPAQEKNTPCPKKTFFLGREHIVPSGGKITREEEYFY